MPPKVRPNNRLLVLCTSINDVTAWPFWKFLQMKKIKGVTDMALLAFNSEGGSFEARIDGDKYSMKNYAKIHGYKEEMFTSFLDRWYDPGRSYFVYGGHGMGDYLEFEQHKLALQAHELAALLDKRRFEAILFDACFMSNLDCAYHLRHNTRFIGASEGYMWEPDTALDFHIFSTFTASAMSRLRDPRVILETIQREYTGKAPRGDFSVLDTTHVAELRAFVNDRVIQRTYNHATLYTPAQQERLSVCAESALERSIASFGQPGGDSYLEGLLASRKHAQSEPATPDAFALSNSGRLSRKKRVEAAVQFEHSLYPSEALDKHLVDLKSYLEDMALEEDAALKLSGGAGGGVKRMTGRRRPRKAAAGAWSPSRAYNVDAHGSLPLPRDLPENEKPPPAQTTQTMSGIDGDATATTTSTSNTTPVESSTTPTTAGVLSLYPKDSARYGLDLFNAVVTSHVAPRSAGIYAARLGGLSVTVHEYSCMSEAAEPWRVSKTIFNRKTKAFLAKGSLEEVSMRAKFAPPQQQQQPEHLHHRTTTATPTATPTTIDQQQQQVVVVLAAGSEAAAAAPLPVSLPSQAATPAAVAVGGGAAAAGPGGCPATTRTTTAATPFLASATSAYSPLSSRYRTYASFSCSAAAAAAAVLPCSNINSVAGVVPPYSSSSSSSSSSSVSSVSFTSSSMESEDGGSVCSRVSAYSADRVREIERLAMVAAQLLDTTARY